MSPTTRSTSSSTSESVRCAAGCSSLRWLTQVCSLHWFVHFGSLLRRVHCDGLHNFTHMQESNCKMASAAGELCIHWISSCPSSSVVHHGPWGLVQTAEFEVTVTRLQPDSWHKCKCMNRQSSHGGSWLDLPTSGAERKTNEG